MESIRELFRIGHGPSSSHTMGPRFAAERFLSKNEDAAKFSVTLYGSLAATGKGHLTDYAIAQVLGKDHTEFIWQPEIVLPYHTNGMKFESFSPDGSKKDEWVTYSVGGGKIANEDSESEEIQIYEHSSISEIIKYIDERGIDYWEYVKEREDSDFWDYLNEVWKAMQAAIVEGIETEGVLPGELHLRRKAADYFVKAKAYRPSLQSRSLVMAFAMAVSEQNAAGSVVVTAPTCGSSGVLPAVLYHSYKQHEMSDKTILRALATAGLFGNSIKKNASISGAEVGCQGEVGSASAMAAAAANQLYGGTIRQIEYAAEMGLEHHLGMTCDPICGLVQVPCIERNAFGALRALDANLKAMLSDGTHIVSFDKVVKVMKTTGQDLPSLYRETSEGGLAKYWSDKNRED